MPYSEVIIFIVSSVHHIEHFLPQKTSNVNTIAQPTNRINQSSQSTMQLLKYLQAASVLSALPMAVLAAPTPPKIHVPSGPDRMELIPPPDTMSSDAIANLERAIQETHLVASPTVSMPPSPAGTIIIESGATVINNYNNADPDTTPTSTTSPTPTHTLTPEEAAAAALKESNGLTDDPALVDAMKNIPHFRSIADSPPQCLDGHRVPVLEDYQWKECDEYVKHFSNMEAAAWITKVSLPGCGPDWELGRGLELEDKCIPLVESLSNKARNMWVLGMTPSPCFIANDVQHKKMGHRYESPEMKGWCEGYMQEIDSFSRLGLGSIEDPDVIDDLAHGTINGIPAVPSQQGN